MIVIREGKKIKTQGGVYVRNLLGGQRTVGECGMGV